MTKAHKSRFSIYPGTTKRGTDETIYQADYEVTCSAHDHSIRQRIPSLLQDFGETFRGVWDTMCLSTACHPQIDSQLEKTIQTLEDMLRAFLLDQPTSWDRYMPLVEFAHNNSYHASIGIALYGKKCQSLLCWYEAGESSILGPELLAETTEQIKKI
ncbi:uncharacterized protein [Arachis hypogaea]|uniref:uncharacterized protein n=1 Tax=Arachis hypogaea TaxID=3818 RepID=UPI003B2215B4